MEGTIAPSDDAAQDHPPQLHQPSLLQHQASFDVEELLGEHSHSHSSTDGQVLPPLPHHDDGATEHDAEHEAEPQQHQQQFQPEQLQQNNEEKRPRSNPQGGPGAAAPVAVPPHPPYLWPPPPPPGYPMPPPGARGVPMPMPMHMPPPPHVMQPNAQQNDGNNDSSNDNDGSVEAAPAGPMHRMPMPIPIPMPLPFPPPPPGALGLHPTSNTATNTSSSAYNNGSSSSRNTIINALQPPALILGYTPQLHRCPTCPLTSPSYSYVTNPGPHHSTNTLSHTSITTTGNTTNNTRNNATQLCPLHRPSTAASITHIRQILEREHRRIQRQIDNSAQQSRRRYEQFVNENKERQLKEVGKMFGEVLREVVRMPLDGEGGVDVGMVNEGYIGERGGSTNIDHQQERTMPRNSGNGGEQFQQQTISARRSNAQPTATIATAATAATAPPSVPTSGPKCSYCRNRMSRPAAMCTSDKCRTMLCATCFDDHKTNGPENSWCSDCHDVVNIVCRNCRPFSSSSDGATGTNNATNATNAAAANIVGRSSKRRRTNNPHQLAPNEFFRCRSFPCEKYVCTQHVRFYDCVVCGRQPFCHGPRRKCTTVGCDDCGRSLCGQMLCALKEGCVCGKRREDPAVDWAITIMGEARRQQLKDEAGEDAEEANGAEEVGEAKREGDDMDLVGGLEENPLAKRTADGAQEDADSDDDAEDEEEVVERGMTSI